MKEGLTQEEKPEEPVCGERNEAGDRVDNEVRGDPAEGRELTIHQEEASKDQRGSEVGMSDRMGENEGANCCSRGQKRVGAVPKARVVRRWLRMEDRVAMGSGTTPSGKMVRRRRRMHGVRD